MTTPIASVAVTAAAEEFIRRMMRFSEYPAGGFRLEVAPGGCSGYRSTFSVEPAPRDGDGDGELSVRGVRLFLPAASRELLDGCTIDFADTAMSGGLTIVSPNAAGCACGNAAETALRPAPATVTLDSIRRMARTRV